MKKNLLMWAAAPMAMSLFLVACGNPMPDADSGEAAATGDAPAGGAPAGGTHVEGVIKLSREQIDAAGIQLGRPTRGGVGSIELPAMIEGDPQATQIVSAAIGGKVVALHRHLGQSVARGETLAVIESREAAQLNGEIEAAGARLALAESNYARERRLFAERVSPEQDLIAARTAATEARIALRLATQQRAASGGGGGGLNRLRITAPIAGQVIGRSVMLGQTVAADAELYRIANLANVSLTMNLQPGDAGRVLPGALVVVTAPGRTGTARVRFLSPALDPQTRLVPVIATIANRESLWRVGEAVRASIELTANGGGAAVRVPLTAVQTVEGKRVIFVRTAEGFKAAPVITGDSAGDMIVIRSGLTGAELIATTNSFTLKAELGKSEATHED